MTAQIRENLIYESEETSMTFCPPLPAGHPLIRVLDNDEIICDGDNGILHSTACWRGYQGTWEIKNRRFYLVGLRGRLELFGGSPCSLIGSPVCSASPGESRSCTCTWDSDRSTNRRSTFECVDRSVLPSAPSDL